MNKTIPLFLLTALALLLVACSGEASAATAAAPIVQEAAGLEVTDVTSLPTAVTYDTPTADSDDLETSESSPDMATILLAGDSISLDGSGATVDGSSITITVAGTYSISGVLNNGQIVVDTADEETVFLILNGANISCATGALI